MPNGSLFLTGEELCSTKRYLSGTRRLFLHHGLVIGLSLATVSFDTEIRETATANSSIPDLKWNHSRFWSALAGKDNREQLLRGAPSVFRRPRTPRGVVPTHTCQNCRLPKTDGPLGSETVTQKAVREHLRSVCYFAILMFSIFFAGASLHAQSVEFLPEIDTYLKLTPNVRVYFQAKDDREGGDPLQATSGPSLQLYHQPLLKLKHIAAFDLNDAKHRLLVFEVGYRYIAAPDVPSENRFLAAVTLHVPMKGAILIADRNRTDLDWKAGTFSWRYRNKLALERTSAIHSYHLIPYVAAETFYESQYEKWSTTSLYAGCLLPVGKHVQFNPYYEHDNNTGKKTNTQVNAMGLGLELFFSVAKR
jgi:hypothetical protein